MVHRIRCIEFGAKTLGYHNVDIYDRRKIEHREPNVEIYGRISLVPMVDYITSKAKVELVSLVVFFLLFNNRH